MTTVIVDEHYLELVEKASKPADLFPDKDSARSVYRRLTRRVHPDTFPPEWRDRATAAFAQLELFWAQLNGRAKPSPAATFTTKLHTWVLGSLVTRGDIANLYQLFKDDDTYYAKIVRSPRNNALIVREATVIERLNSELPDPYPSFYPTLVDSFKHRDTRTGKDRQAVVLQRLEGFYSLREVMDRYPQGLDPRDLAWMARRLWAALANAHHLEIAHCAVTPENVMIHPADHGLVLLDWAFSRDFKDRLKFALPDYLSQDWYGTAYDKPLDHRLDVHLASHTLEALLGPRRFKPFNAFFRGCRLASTPQAEQLFKEFDELLVQLYGRRRYRPFSMAQPETERT